MGTKIPSMFQHPQTNWHVVHIIDKSDGLDYRLCQQFVFLPVPRLYSFIAATAVFGHPVVVRVVRWYHVKGDISASLPL